MALHGRDNSEDLNYNEDKITHVNEKSALLIVESDEESDASTEIIPTVIDVTPGINRTASAPQMHERNLHDVEKLFERAPRFDILDLTSGSQAVVSEQASDTPITVDDSRLYCEDDFSSYNYRHNDWHANIQEEACMGHRRDSFPHIHHPLRPIRTKSQKHADHEAKRRKKKKKKKHRMRTTKSFPSRSAALSPTIHEVDEEVSDLSSSSSSLTDESDEKEEIDGQFPDNALRLQVNLVPGESLEGETLPPSPFSAPASLAENTAPPILIPQIVTEPPSSPIPIPSPENLSSPVEENKSILKGSKPLLASFDSGGEEVGFYIGDHMSTGRTQRQNSIDSVGGADEPLLSVPDGDTDRVRSQSLREPGEEVRGRRSGSVLSEDGERPKVKFSVGGGSFNAIARTQSEDSEFLMDYDKRNNSEGEISEMLPRSDSQRSHRSRRSDRYNEENLIMRRQAGSEVQLDDILRRVPTEQEEALLLHQGDLDEMASHRLENMRGLRRHKVAKHKHRAASVIHFSKTEKTKKKITKKKKYDHSPHEVFVELDELSYGDHNEYEWKEKARWIKFEEDVEEGAERWGKPHVASLSFHSLLELRRGLENGTMLLDLEATDLSTIVNAVIDSMINHDKLGPENKGNVLRTLLMKHRHVGETLQSYIRRNISYMNLSGLDSNKNRHQKEKPSLMRSISQLSLRTNASDTSSQPNLYKASLANVENGQPLSKRLFEKQLQEKEKEREKEKDKVHAKDLQFVKVDVDNNMAQDGVHIGIQTSESSQKHIQDIMRRIPPGAEASTVLVGSVDYLDYPIMAFVRLAEGVFLENVTEVPLPVRFVFILLGPEKATMDYHEVGRSISTLMSNQYFHDVAYRAESRDELLQAINEFLDESIVLPPGDWDQRTLLPITEMNRKRARIRRRKKQKEEEKLALQRKEEKEKVPLDPLKRTGRIFGGMINDIKRRYPHYVSDFKDALNLKCLAAFIFIFFACFAPCIAFGGLLGEKTEGYMGVTETVVSTSLSGIVFGLFAGQPLMIVGATGPVLVFEQSLYKFCKSSQLEFLTMRVWIGFWVMLMSIIVVALESSFLVRYITRFTEEIFAILISLIFIQEVIKKLDYTFHDHPLLTDYCDVGPHEYNSSHTNHTEMQNYTVFGNYSIPNATDVTSFKGLYDHDDDYGKHVKNQPNTALLTTILCLGTFLIAHFLKVFRNSKFLGRSARRALGDFGICIAIIVMVLLDYSINDIYTQKLEISGPFIPTRPAVRGWFVHPMGTKKPFQLWAVFAAIIPAFLIFILLFLETQITEMILNKKEFKLKKGSGFHLDQVLMGVMTFVCALLGLPWMCAATVRTLAHTHALSIMSKTHAPGEKPKLVEVKEQRVTNILMNTIIGLSLFWGPLLNTIPLAVLFGVFLYLGVSALSGVQMFKRIKLLFIPVKHHPSISYVRRVRTMKMHIYTIIQVVFLVLLLITKLTAAALAFPLFVIFLIPIRLKLMGFIFSEQELEVLDKEEEDSDFEDEDDPDFYQQAHMPI